ncbi:MAG: hypothetical protein GC181_04425 [Bacteroidetes bacterium]|nr:hypothetical protein [Bacteroidota bacterium]
MNGKILIVLLIFTFSVSACKKDDVCNCTDNPECSSVSIPSATIFDALPVQSFQVKSVEADNENINLTITVGGCDLDRTFELIVSPDVMESNPVQRNCKLIYPEQYCKALLTGSMCFNRKLISETTVLNLQTSNGVVKINLP